MKKIVTVIGVIIAVMAIGFIGNRKYTKSFSPEAVASYKKSDLDINVYYCQPFKKNREIFGNPNDRPLVPYGSVWRTGANEATEIEFNQNLKFGGEVLEKGRYAVFTIPSEDSWIVIFNRDLGQWGAFEYDSSKDALRIKANSRIVDQDLEQFQVSFAETPNGLGMNFDWDNVQVNIPIERP